MWGGGKEDCSAKYTQSMFCRLDFGIREVRRNNLWIHHVNYHTFVSNLQLKTLV